MKLTDNLILTRPLVWALADRQIVTNALKCAAERRLH
jgi:hypothetical protein